MNITYSNARNPVFVDESETTVNLEVNFDHLPEEWVWFTASPNDASPHAADILSKALNGDFGTIAPYTAPE